MIGIEYLNKPNDIRMSSGLEYLAYQKTTFFEELKEHLRVCYDMEKHYLNLDEATLSQIIKKYTNISVTVIPIKHGNLAIDTAFISPKTILNNKMVDRLFKNSKTKIAEAYRQLKTNVISGWCDLKTGKVEGDFKNIDFKLFINPNALEYINKHQARKLNFHPADLIAAAIMHECGHVFFGLHYLTTTVIDNVIIAQAIKLFNEEPDPRRRVDIVNDANKVLDIKLDTDVIDEKTDDKKLVVYFSKGTQERDTRRSLSVGVETMSSEVLADMYAIRMGGGKEIVLLLNGIMAYSFYLNSPIKLMFRIAYAELRSTIICIVFTAILPAAIIPLLTAISGVLKVYGYVKKVSWDLVPGIYDTPYRRMKTILKEDIALLRENKHKFLPQDYNEALENALKLEKMVESNKPFFESTDLQRICGWIRRGKDFRKIDFEHYTSELTNSNLTLYTDHFSRGK